MSVLSHWFNRSLRTRVTLGVVLPLTVILGVITLIEYTRYRAAVLNNAAALASHSGQVVESTLRHAMLESDFAEVQGLLDTVGAMQEFQIVYLLDTSGQVIFAPNGEGVGIRLENQAAECRPCHSLPVGERPSSAVITRPGGERVFRSMHPIENSPECARCHGSDQRLLGLLLTDLSMAPLEEALRADFYEHLVWWTLTLLVTVLVVNLVLSRFVLSRLEKLALALQQFGRDQWSPSLVEPGPDEIGQLAGTFNVMAGQVQTRSEENRRLSETLRQESAMRGELLRRLITAQEDERRRLARELHDELGQALSGLSLRMEALERLIASNPAQAPAHIAPIRALIDETTGQMYHLIMDLRPSSLDDLGLEAALSAYAKRLLDGTPVEYELDASALERRLPPEVETTLYRVFQEALNNVLRHAQARHVKIAFAQRGGALEAAVVDDGCGFNVEAVNLHGQAARGLGLLGMRERIAQCGGAMEIISQPGKGTRLVIRLPLSEGSCL